MVKPWKVLTSVGANAEVAAASGSTAPTRSLRVLTLLEREVGATLTKLIEATGWKRHTTRAALTGLRKKGDAVGRRKRDDLTCYHLPKAAA